MHYISQQRNESLVHQLHSTVEVL